MDRAAFLNLNFGTKVSTVKQDIVKVVINPQMVEQYAQAYVAESRRVNPLASDEVNLTPTELNNYFKFLLKVRIDSLSPDGSKEWRKVKLCYIPDFFQFVLSMVGEVTDQTHGLKFVPVYQEEVPNVDILEVSRKIEFFNRYGLTASKDAMPRGTEGDKDVMGFAILDGFVYGRTELQAPIASYVAAFLGFKLAEEASFKMLYRVRYDDVEFIKDALIHERSVLG